MASKTRKNKAKSKVKAKAKAKAKNLAVESVANIADFEKMLNSASITIILVYADWCGACHKFRKNIWNPMLQRNAIHNRIAIPAEMMNKTSLANAKFDYLPSILVVDEKGNMQDFQTPEGKMTNAMPTPQSLEDMTRVVNVPLASEPQAEQEEEEEAPPRPLTPWMQKKDIEEPENLEIIPTRPMATPEGKTYVAQKGGRRSRSRSGSLLRMLERVIQKGLKIGRETRKTKKST